MGVGGRPGEWTCRGCLPPSRPGWKAQMSETKAISSSSSRARSSGCPALTCVLPEVCSSQNAGSLLRGGMSAVGGAGAKATAYCMGSGSWMIYGTGQAPVEISFVLLWAQTRWWLGPSEDRLEQYAAPGHGALPRPCLGNGREDAPFLVLCGGYGRPVLLRTAFQPGIRHLPDGLDPVHV